MEHLDAGGETDLAVLFGQLANDVSISQTEIDCLTAGVPKEKAIESIFAGLAAYDTNPAINGISVGGSVDRLCNGAVIEAVDPTTALEGQLTIKGVCWDNGTVSAITSTGSACAASGFAEPALGVSFSDRAWDGYVDPARESSNGLDINQGRDSVTIEFLGAMENADGSAISADAFTLTDTNGTPPGIVSATSSDGGKTVTLQLDGFLTLQHWTTVEFNGRNACSSEAFLGSIDIGTLPCDVNQDARCNPLDLTALRQLVFGTGSATKVWNGEVLPARP
jgi:hypothetical protein